jgi:4-aminobutyrate aminotransferase / (S)-3-amino-2-methylpropionate transaminase / 5-aminovalerate transaminase
MSTTDAAATPAASPATALPNASLPNTARLTAERDRWVANGTTGRPFFVERAEGALVWDVDGREFVDFVGGIGTVNHGHRNPEIVAAVRDQLDRYLHQCFSVSSYEPYVEVCRLLCESHPGDFAKKAMLVNSGAEAVENAVKIARYATGRQGIVCLDNAFHGRTLLAMSLTAKVRPYKLGFGPFAPEIYRAPGPYPYRGVSSDDAIAGMERLFKNQIDPSNIAAIIYEPVQGEGGFLPMPEDYPMRIQELAAEHGILVIADEVQAGMGRTGLPAASSHYGIEPDLATWGKSMGGGLPIAGVTGRAEIMDSVHKGGIGGTYGGNPLSCAAAIVAINQVLDPGFQDMALAFGAKLRAELDALAGDVGAIGEVRGLGAMLAAELVKDPVTREPDAERTAAVAEAAFERGLLVFGAGVYSNVLRVLVPLVATDEQVRFGFDVLREAFAVTEPS